MTVDAVSSLRKAATHIERVFAVTGNEAPHLDLVDTTAVSRAQKALAGAAADIRAGAAELYATYAFGGADENRRFANEQFDAIAAAAASGAARQAARHADREDPRGRGIAPTDLAGDAQDALDALADGMALHDPDVARTAMDATRIFTQTSFQAAYLGAVLSSGARGWASWDDAADQLRPAIGDLRAGAAAIQG